MGIKFANEIIKEIVDRGKIYIPPGFVTGKNYEESIYEEEKENVKMEKKKFTETIPVVINANNIWDIDIGCIPFVEFFNNIGLITKFSCYGHRSYEEFMIMFDDTVTPEMIEAFIRIIGAPSASVNFSLWTRLLYPGVISTLFARNMIMTINPIIPIDYKHDAISRTFTDIVEQWNVYKQKDSSDMFLQSTLDTPVDVSVICPYCQEKINHRVIKLPSVIQNRCSCGQHVHSIITDLSECEK